MFCSVVLGCSGGIKVLFSNLLEEYAQRCIRLAYGCQNKNAERFLRLLAVDLMLAARMQQTRSNNEVVATTVAPAINVAAELAELGRLSQAAAAKIKPESASRA
jgi:hypothetical protein